jgi:glycosyltransferase involved in cell wall biosynthesis
MVNILYFTFIENPFAPENSGVMRGQIINLLKTIGVKHSELNVYWLALIRTSTVNPTDDQVKSLKEELQEFNVTLILKKITTDTLVGRWQFAEKELKKCVDKLQPDILHCRVYPATLVANRVRKKYQYAYRIIFDARGVYPEQILERNSKLIGKIRYYWWKYLEKKLLKRSDLIIGVTNAFIQHFKRIVPEAEYKYIPCCFNQHYVKGPETKSNIRKQIGFSVDDTVIVYSGNLSAQYSSLGLLIDVFSQINSLVEKARFLILTKSDTTELNSLLNEYALRNNSVIKSLSPEQVPLYLSAADIAILFREESIVNEVAMPTKFAEYLSCGLPVIVSRSIKGVAQLTEEFSVGVVLDKPVITSEIINKLLDMKPEHCQKVSEAFTVENIADMYYHVYIKLAKK